MFTFLTRFVFFSSSFFSTPVFSCFCPRFGLRKTCGWNIFGFVSSSHWVYGDIMWISSFISRYLYLSKQLFFIFSLLSSLFDRGYDFTARERERRWWWWRNLKRIPCWPIWLSCYFSIAMLYGFTRKDKEEQKRLVREEKKEEERSEVILNVKVTP